MMNITRDLTPTYYATCDICDSSGPVSQILADAVVTALEEGWTVTSRWNSLEYVSTTLCPRCSSTSYEARHYAGLEATE